MLIKHKHTIVTCMRSERPGSRRVFTHWLYDSIITKKTYFLKILGFYFNLTSFWSFCMNLYPFGGIQFIFLFLTDSYIMCLFLWHVGTLYYNICTSWIIRIVGIVHLLVSTYREVYKNYVPYVILTLIV